MLETDPNFVSFSINCSYKNFCDEPDLCENGDFPPWLASKGIKSTVQSREPHSLPLYIIFNICRAKPKSFCQLVYHQ